MIIFSTPSRGQQVMTLLGAEQTTSSLVVLILPAFVFQCDLQHVSVAVFLEPPGADRAAAALGAGAGVNLGDPHVPLITPPPDPLGAAAGDHLRGQGTV